VLLDVIVWTDSILPGPSVSSNSIQADVIFDFYLGGDFKDAVDLWIRRRYAN